MRQEVPREPVTLAGTPLLPSAISMRGFVRELRRVDLLPISQTFVFLLGAGASVSSKIPGARQLAEDWLREMHEQDATGNHLPLEQWLREGRHGLATFDPKDAAASYSEIFDRRFAANPNQGYAHLTKLMTVAQPGFGYSVLATMLATSKHRAVITTNFDTLVERALLYYTDATPLTCTDETAAGEFDRELSCPLIVKCHRDLHLRPHNGVRETSVLHANFGAALRSLLPGKVLIVIGYGGNDPSLMGFLESLPREQWPSAVYWCYWSRGGLPSARILAWIRQHTGRLVAIPGFDELMSGISGEFGFGLLDKKMAEQHESRVRRYKTQVEQIARRSPATAESAPAHSTPRQTSETSMHDMPTTAAGGRSESPADDKDAVDFASESIAKTISAGQRPKTSWELVLSFLSMEDLAAKDAAFQKALADHPDDSTIARYYASFLNETSRYREAASIWDRAIATEEAERPCDERCIALDCVSRGIARSALGDFTRAAADFARSVAWFESHTPRDERNLASCYALLTRASIDSGDVLQAKEYLDKSVAWLPPQSSRDERELAPFHFLRAVLSLSQGDLAAADDSIAKTMAAHASKTTQSDHVMANSYGLRANIRHARGDLARAREDIATSITLEESRVPHSERDLAVWWVTRANILRDLGDLAAASADVERSIAWAASQRPRCDRALAESDVSGTIALKDPVARRNERDLAFWYATRASIRQELGDTVGAERDMVDTIAWFRANEPQNSPRMGADLRNQARILAAAGKWKEAQASIDESLPLHELAFGGRHEWTRRARVWQAKIRAREVPPRWIDTRA